jgi:hypothetical protein
MFTWRVRDQSGVSCVKLPAAVAFPTDDRLIQRIEEARRALPRNSVKPLWRSREPECAELRPELRANEIDLQPLAEVSGATIERFRAARAEMRSTLIRMNELCPPGRTAVG